MALKRASLFQLTTPYCVLRRRVGLSDTGALGLEIGRKFEFEKGGKGIDSSIPSCIVLEEFEVHRWSHAVVLEEVHAPIESLLHPPSHNFCARH